MIITNLAAQAYAGETELWSALVGVVDRMPQYVSSVRPRVPNPADPAEDYADKWAKDPTLEDNFWLWHTQVKIDIARLPTFLSGGSLASGVQATFRMDLTLEEVRQFEPRLAPATPVTIRSAPALFIAFAPRPWGDGA